MKKPILDLSRGLVGATDTLLQPHLDNSVPACLGSGVKGAKRRRRSEPLTPGSREATQTF